MNGVGQVVMPVVTTVACGSTSSPSTTSWKSSGSASPQLVLTQVLRLIVKTANVSRARFMDNRPVPSQVVMQLLDTIDEVMEELQFE